MTRFPWLRTLRRALLGRPGLSALVISALAIGLAANAVMLSVIDATVLRPFPFPDPDRLVGIGASYPRANRPLSFFEVVSGPEIADLARDAGVLEHPLGFDLNNEAIVIEDEPYRVFTAFVWSDPFATFQIAPALGRTFTQNEVDQNAPVAVISDVLWRSAFNADPGIVGRQFRLNDRVFDIIAVAPPRTRIYGTDLWIPMPERFESLTRNRRQFNLLARVSASATSEQVTAALERVARRIEATHGESYPEYAGFAFGTRPWTEIDAWGLGDVGMVAYFATGLVLLLVVANLASLLMARAASRRREAAVRAALGASRLRIAGVLVSDALIQTGVGAAAGLALSWLAVSALPAVIPAGVLPAEVTPAINLRVIAALLGAALLSALVVGAWPSLHLARVHPTESLQEDGARSVGGRATRRLHATVIAFEVAAAMVVAGSAALLTVHTARLLEVDRGFDAERMLTMRMTLPVSQYDGERSLAFFDTLLEQVRALPSVDAASASNQPPPGAFSRSQYEIAGRPTTGDDPLPTAYYTTAASGYRETLGLRLVAGRWFNERAPMSGAREVVVNERLAARDFADTGPVGQRVRVPGPAGDGEWTDIVGVVADVRNDGLAVDPQPEMIASVRQIPDRRRTQLYLVIRYRQGHEAPIAEVRRLVQALDPVQPVYAISTLSQQFESSVGSRRAAAWVLAVFSVLATGLAGLGIFGVLVHAVSERSREIALRMALGGSRGAIVQLVLRQALVPMAIGLVIGVAAVAAGERWLSSWLFGLSPEPGLIGLAAVALALVGLMAAAWPALIASRLSPMALLRR